MEPEEITNGIATEDAAADHPTEAAPAPSVLAELVAERDRLIREKAELQDLLQRRQAEFDNFRRRSERERSEVFEFASMDAVKALLPVLDDFERALKVESADKEYARVMELIYQRFSEALKKLGLEPISAESPIFNPHIHHAVEMVDTKDYPDQTILEEYQRGYSFKGRLVRPAMVKVAVNL
ncbi:MAG: GrpE protein [Bryobacterales bacterium]|nr:GrpE protein [Bryobacterales bacterium]